MGLSINLTSGLLYYADADHLVVLDIMLIVNSGIILVMVGILSKKVAPIIAHYVLESIDSRHRSVSHPMELKGRNITSGAAFAYQAPTPVSYGNE